MASDLVARGFPKRSSSTDSSSSVLSDGHPLSTLSRPPSDEDFNRFLGILCQLDDSDRPENNSTEARRVATDAATETCHHEQATSEECPDVACSQGVIVVPLRRWMEQEAGNAAQAHQDPHLRIKTHNESMIRKITVGFGIGKLLQVVSGSKAASRYSLTELESLCAVDNFILELASGGTCEPGWELEGVVMVMPFSSLRIHKASTLSSNWDKASEVRTGRHVMAEIMCPLFSNVKRSATGDSSDVDMSLCYLFGTLLHFLFAGTPNQSPPQDDESAVGIEEPLSKKRPSVVFARKETQCPPNAMPVVRGTAFSQAMSIVGDQDEPEIGRSKESVGDRDELEMGRSKESVTTTTHIPLIDYGYPFSLSQLVMNLIDCRLGLFRPDDAYPSLDEAISDIQVLLQQPSRYLWNHNNTPHFRNLFTSDVKLYGRSEEVAILTSAFCRVSCAGRSEAVFVSGFSGCGKTRLVHSFFDTVNVLGGYAVTRKFDEMNSSSSLHVVLSAFNELCILVGRRSSQEHLIRVHQNLTGSIGTNIVLLTGLLPNLVDLFPSHVALPVSHSQVRMNFDGLCFAVQCLMRAISSPSEPVLFFLDDLHWADDLSLKLVHYVLSDARDGNCMLFVGGFRENEMMQDNVLLELFSALSTADVVSTVMHLDGIGSNDLISLISDTLGIFPRLCKGLADVVFRKTNGNPFFTLEFLRSLLARGLVWYSLRNKCWKWNLSLISEENITDNVLQLLTKKMIVLTETNQTALKVASCFGSSISISVVEKLSRTFMYSSLQATLDEIGVKEGFVDFDGTTYRFVHDKVREAAYGLIADKEQYHLDIGMALQFTDNNEIIAAIQQIKHSSPSLVRDDRQRVSIANLGFEAGMKAMSFFDFAAAHSYYDTARTFLPPHSWADHYELTLKCNFQLAKAAYSRGWLEESKQICDEIIEHGKCLEDILETYSLLVSLSSARKDLLIAFNSCLKVLNLLGEVMPADTVNANELLSITTKTKALFQSHSSQDLLDMPEEKCSRKLAIMDFFDQLAIVSFYLKPKVWKYYCVRWASFCIINRVVCKYTPGAFVSFGSILSQQGLDEDMRLACRVGKLGMIMLNRNEKAIDQVPGVHEVYFTWVGILTEPIQAQIAICQHAHKVGMLSGNLLTSGLILGTIFVRSIYAGINLHDLKKDIEVHLKSAKKRSQQLLQMHLSIEYDVVTRLIGDEKFECSCKLDSESPVLDVIKFTLEMMASFYQDHLERVLHKSKLWDSLSDFHRWKVPLGSIFVSFFSGLASFCLHSRGKQKNQRHIKTLSKALSTLEKASQFSEWNYKNKYLLLKAAYLTVTGNSFEAGEVYDNAISASRASKFVHEEGLACEFAAMHHKKHGNNAFALSLLSQAESCYKIWGSNIKEAHIARLKASIQV